MSFEKYSKIYEDYNDGTTLRTGGTPMTVRFDTKPKKDTKYRLFAVGETEMFYQWKNEPDMPRHYLSICDALNSENARKARFCLDLSSKRPETYIRRVYKRIKWPPFLSYIWMNPIPTAWKYGVWVKADGLHIEKDGYLHMMVELRRQKEGVNPNSVENQPDEVHIIDLCEGTYDWTKLEKEIQINGNTALIGVWFEGVRYSGKIYIESPFLSADGQNLLPEFDMPLFDKEHFDWTAQYLSRKEWPEFEITLNGQVILQGEIFERCHRDSEWEIDLPYELLTDKNELTIKLISDYHDPLPYSVHELGIIEHPDAELSLIAVSPSGSVSEGAYLLVRTRAENTIVSFESLDGILQGEKEYHFAEAGLHGIRLGCHAAAPSARFALTSGNCRIEGMIDHIFEKTADGVVTGTGDLIYIEQALNDVEEYLSWYISNGVGNLVTIRPTYRWSGTRELSPEVWRLFTRVLNELGMKYSLMVDGRELPGLNANPDDGMLAGDGYLGRQTHEFDGTLFYWGAPTAKTATDIQNWEMRERIFYEDPRHTNLRCSPKHLYWRGDTLHFYKDPDIPRDTLKTKEAKQEVLKTTRYDATRHTGPAVMFKYFLESGYDWVGAETMYQTLEPMMSFIRGATASYGKNAIGVHHAVQWSSSPHDCQAHFDRYRLALYGSYMQGATEINTEEGLWHLEEYYAHYHRFSSGCIGHLEEHRDFYRYLVSHSRTGKFYTPVALIHGNCDGWHGFGNHHPWGWSEQPISPAEKSWELLKVFYPMAKPGVPVYIHGAPEDRPLGYHSGTPIANVDAIPAEDQRGLLSSYRFAAFLGYNYAELSHAENLIRFVNDGGKLLLTRAHLTSTTDFENIKAGRLTEAIGHPLSFTDGEPIYREGHVNGKPVRVCTNILSPDKILKNTDEGTPLILRYKLGQGSVILVNALCYPANPAIRSDYETLLGSYAHEACAAEWAWCETPAEVGSAVWEQPDGSRHFYFIANDWYHPKDDIRTAMLRIGNDRYEIQMPFGTMIKCVVSNACAAWPHSEDGEVLSVTDGAVTVQGKGIVAFTLAKNGKAWDASIDFSEETVQTLFFEF